MKATLNRTINQYVSITLSGEEMAELFWSLGEDEQARFFNYLGSKHRLPMQLQVVTDSDVLTYEGRYAMERIGEYAQPTEDVSSIHFTNTVNSIMEAITGNDGGIIYVKFQTILSELGCNECAVLRYDANWTYHRMIENSRGDPFELTACYQQASTFRPLIEWVVASSK